jgi:rhodanese-related sulfurtransferase
MKKPIKPKTKKIIETEEIIHSSSLITRSILSFFSSFIIIVGFILGLYWYGKQIYKSASLLFRAPIIAQLPTNKTISNTLYYDPLNLFEDMKNNNSNIVFLDIRSSSEYKVAHIKNAISVPFYTLENDKIRYFDITETMKKITIQKSKFIVIYGPSTSFQYQQTVQSRLSKSGYSTQLLAIGWNELRHFQNIWIPEGLWGKIDVNTILEDSISIN